LSPIFVRPVREQLEHDRLIRHLQTRYKRKFEALINPGEEHAAPVKLGTATFYPDVVLMEGKKLAGLVEVETGESVNNLEAMAQWVHFARSRVPFHLYVPVTAYDAARRLCDSHQARVAEIWTYRPAVDGFDLVRMFHDTVAVTAPSPAKKPVATPAKPVTKTASKPTPKPAAPHAKKTPAGKPTSSKAAKGTKTAKNTKAPKAARGKPGSARKR
jgi:hypothetical protein